MINRRITLIGPEGTNLYIVFQFILFNVISWFTLYTSIESLEFTLSNLLFRQIIFSTIGIGIFFLTTYISINQVAELSFFFILVSIILLFGLLLTEPIVGVNRWYSLEAIGLPVYLQVSEFSKIFVINFNKYNFNISSTRFRNIISFCQCCFLYVIFDRDKI